MEDNSMAETAEWYYAKDGESVGPMTLAQLRQALPAVGGARALVYGPGSTDWTEARLVAALVSPARASSAGASPPAASAAGARAQAGSTSGTRAAAPASNQAYAQAASSGTAASDVIDYEIFGSEMQYVAVTLDPGEMVLAEAGGMMYMTPGIEMETVFGDPSAPAGGFWSKVAAAGKRVMTGESLFMTTFTNTRGSGRETVAFASPFPGKILPMHLDELGGELICQKDSFVCAARGTKIGIAFRKRIGVGLFGGEGFIMQRLTGDGIALMHAGGMMMRRTLEAGETLRVDTGCLVALQPSVDYDIQLVKGVKNKLFGGEGLFFATLTGPGEVWLQSLPFSRLAGRIVAAAPQTGKANKGEGSILGGLGRLFDGDNS
jgi:uncharacterized protein (TIGR00266 family)